MKGSDTGAPQGPLFSLALGVLVVLLMALSPLALIALGLNYEDTGGSPLEKMHPATALAAALVLATAIVSGNPVRWGLASVTANRSLLPYLGVIALLVVHSVKTVGLPFTHFIDTFVLPALLFLLFHSPDEARGRHLAWMIHALMAANAMIGIGELASGLRITPLVAGGVAIEDDWRSTALLGHPLANACLTGGYLLMLALGGGRDLHGLLRSALFLLNAGAMIAFGGRAASVLVVVTLMLIAATKFTAILRGGTFSTVSILKALLIAPAVALATTVLLEHGSFDLFIERFIDDKGSAETRIEMFELLHRIPLGDLLLGPDAGQVSTLQHMHGLEFGIESFWVSFVLSYGLVLSLVFFAVLAWFTADTMRHMQSRAAWVIGYFYAVASTSLSLSAKSPLLAVLTLMMLVLMRPLPVRARVRAAAHPSRRSTTGLVTGSRGAARQA
ncbi:MAG: VpsF family polysaccharide biosynthesis protein [Hyphomicrobiaceae bacterium]|nr:VpsF family polysaccharide biosynthesis protein [Hyphomicrobiaceae bacterium]